MRLEIVVAPNCPPCLEARSIAGEAATRFPALEVELIELDGRRPLPERVVATPTYLLDGVVVSLGNPPREALFAEIECRQRRAGTPRWSPSISS
jgi:hypothetical protein